MENIVIRVVEERVHEHFITVRAPEGKELDDVIETVKELDQGGNNFQGALKALKHDQYEVMEIEINDGDDCVETTRFHVIKNDGKTGECDFPFG